MRTKSLVGDPIESLRLLCRTRVLEPETAVALSLRHADDLPTHQIRGSLNEVGPVLCGCKLELHSAVKVAAGIPKDDAAPTWQRIRYAVFDLFSRFREYVRQDRVFRRDLFVNLVFKCLQEYYSRARPR